MRRDSTTIVVLTGQIDERVLGQAGRSLNISVAHIPGPRPAGSAGADAERPPAWEVTAAALRTAAGRSSGYVLLPVDPLADVAEAWQGMWQAGAAPEAPAAFEQSAAEALNAWRAKRFELPDYYLVVADSATAATGQDWYLGPLRAARPRRIALAIAGAADPASQAAPVLDTLRSLEHGPWWPPLEDLIDGARGFYAGGVLPSAPGSPSP